MQRLAACAQAVLKEQASSGWWLGQARSLMISPSAVELSTMPGACY